MSYFLQSNLNNAAEEALRSHPYSTDPLEYLAQLMAKLDFLPPLPEEVDFESRSRPPISGIFISYSTKNALLVLGLVPTLIKRGYSVCIDCFDLPLNPIAANRQAAETIRRRMVQSRSLFVVTTQHAPTSRWVPWELGFTDGLTNKAATLFIAPAENADFGRQSYFSLYPEVLDGPKFLRKGEDLIIADPQAAPPWHDTWIDWLSRPRRY